MITRQEKKSVKIIPVEHPLSKFIKSSFSASDATCVGIASLGDSIVVNNTNEPQITIQFTKEEWRAFVLGVKNNEFDVS